MSREPLRSVGDDPDYRFTLANERTFLAWIRTSLALLAGGVAVLSLLDNTGSTTLRVALGLALLTLSLIVSVLAYLRWRQAERALRTGGVLPGHGLLGVMTGGVVVLVVLVGLLALL